MKRIKKYSEKLLSRSTPELKKRLNNECEKLHINESTYIRKAVDICLKERLIKRQDY